MNYGRLFTEADVRTLMLVAHIRGFRKGRGEGGRGVDERDQIIRDFDAGAMTGEVDELLTARPTRDLSGALTFPPDEPLFLLRGQDIAAPGTIFNIPGEDRYDYLDRAKCAGAPDDHLRAIEVAGRKMAAWQKANPERVRVPSRCPHR